MEQELSIILLLSRCNDESLADFAEQLFSVLEMRDYERRESSNYLDEEYFSARGGGVHATIAWSDEGNSSQFPFYMGIVGTPADVNRVARSLKSAMCGKNKLSGKSAMQIINFGRQSERSVSF